MASETCSQTALVAGATGYLGRHIVNELKRRGLRVRALIRRPEQRAALEAMADEIHLGQVTEPATLHGIARGVDMVFSTIGITRQKDGFTYEEIDYRGNLNLLHEAVASGAGNFLYVSVLHGQNLRHTRLVAAKERFVDALNASSIAHCVMRPSGFFSDMAEFLAMARKGPIVLIGNGQARLNPISGRDLALVCVDAAIAGRAEVEAGGPAVYTQNEIANLAFSALHKRASIWHLPGWTGNAASAALRALVPVRLCGPIEFFLAAATQDAAAPCYGKDRLEDFFHEKADSAIARAAAHQLE
jgi:uncharacterized protein YbjT (DUF2867 family)